MASKENKFAKSGGGAMLAPSKEDTSSSFGMRLGGKNQPPMHSQNQGSRNPNAGGGLGDNADSLGSDNALANNNSVSNQGGSDIQGSNGIQDAIQKEALKKAGETALKAAGVPSVAAQKVVDTADKTGALDKVNEYVARFKKKKVRIVMSVLSAILPVLLFFVVIMMFAAFVNNIRSKIDGVVNFFYEVAETSYKIAVGYYGSEYRFSAGLPDAHDYLDSKLSGLTEEEKNARIDGEIQKISDIIASITAAVTYKSSVLEEQKLFCSAGVFLSATTSDICALSFSGLSTRKNGVNSSLYSEFSGKELKDKIESLGCASTNVPRLVEAEDGTKKYEKSIFSKIIDDIYGAAKCANVRLNTLDSFYVLAFKLDSDNKDKDPYWVISQGWKTIISFFTGKIESHDQLEEALEGKRDAFENLGIDMDKYNFDEDTYREFLVEYYIPARYYDMMEDKEKAELGNNATQEEINNIQPRIINEIADDIIMYQQIQSQKLVEEITETLENSEKTGSLGDDGLTSSLSPVYGDSSCTILKPYNHLTHEFIETSGVTSKDIHSISDGEVVYVKNASNIYDKYDTSTKKCMCDGKECEDSLGSVIKVKFTYDSIYYIVTYAHLDKIFVKEGDVVSKGSIIATEGNTGCTNYQKLSLTVTSENGYNYNVDELLSKCSNTSNTLSLCNLSNLAVNIVDSNKNSIDSLNFYDYVKNETYRLFNKGINNKELLKVGIISTASNILSSSDYEVGMKEITIEANSSYVAINSSDAKKLDQALESVRGSLLVYSGKIVKARMNLVCNRDDSTATSNSVYNILCVNKAIDLANRGKSYKEILSVYYPNYTLVDNYCLDYASSINKYSLNNDKSYFTSLDDKDRYDQELEEIVNDAGKGTRAASVEVARYLLLGFDQKIKYKNGGKYFSIGFNANWASDGFDSCGFISWVLLNGGAKIDKSMSIPELIKSNNIAGNLKINSSLYKYFDQIQVGDFVYKDGQIGIIIGKNDGKLYVASTDLSNGLIVSTITSYGESSANFTDIYFADNYYNGIGEITSMW